MATKDSDEPLSNSAGLLKSLITRIEAQNARVKDEQEDRKEIYAEAKSLGYNPKIVRKLVARRAMEKAKRDEEDALLHTYSKAVGTPSPADFDDDDEYETTVVAEFRGVIRKDEDGNVIDEGMKRTR